MSENVSTIRTEGPPPAAPPWALVAGGLSLLFALAWSALALTHLDSADFSPDYFYDGAKVALYLSFALAGLFIIVNRRARGLGAVLLVTGLLYTLRFAAELAAGLAGAGPLTADFLAVPAVAASVSYAFMELSFPLWLPDGRLPGGRWRVLPALVGFWSVVTGFRNVARSPDFYGVANPLQHGSWNTFAGHLEDLLGGGVSRHVFTGVVFFGLVVALVRWRRSPGPHRQLVEVLVPYLIWMALVTVPYYLDSYPDWLPYAIVVAGPAVWVLGLGAAFRRDRSLSLDRSTRRCLCAYAFSTLLFIAVLAAGYLAHRFLPGDGPRSAEWWWTVLVAAVLGALLRPAAIGVVHAVDRYYYGERARPYHVARDLAERMSLAVNPAEAPPLLCATVVNALGLPAATVRLHTDTGPRRLAGLGAEELPSESFPLRYEGATIGDLRVSPRSGQRALDRQDREVLALLADQASPAVASLRLYKDLQSSRKRIVLAREEERRRLRHDLHDGLGPALSGLRLQVDAARSGIEGGPGKGADPVASLSAASAGIGQAITELRRITDGLAPAALGAEGLSGALRQLADGLGGRALEVTLVLDPDPLPPLPAAVEVAVYRISGEALNNVVRHSGATSARLTLHVGADCITVEAHDDGAGFPAHSSSAGVGLRSMAERAEELGGSFSAANDARGAVVRAVFPRSVTAEQNV